MSQEQVPAPELLAVAITREGPFRIDSVEHHDPVVTLSGANWSLGLLCRWRLLRDGSLVIDSDHALADEETGAAELVTDLLWDLVGQSITGARSSRKNHNDPILTLTGGYVLELEADTDLDPWVFNLPSHVIVGSMT